MLPTGEYETCVLEGHTLHSLTGMIVRGKDNRACQRQWWQDYHQRASLVQTTCVSLLIALRHLALTPRCRLDIIGRTVSTLIEDDALFDETI